MAWTTGFTTVSNTGTWMEFFNQLKQTIKDRTGFTVTDGETDYTFTIEFGNGFTCVVSDTVITSKDVTSTSGTLKFVTYQDGVSRNSTNITYLATPAGQSTTATRTIPMFTYGSPKILAVSSYSYTNIQLISYAYMMLDIKDIVSGETKTACKVGSNAVYDTDGNSYTMTTPMSQFSSPGIVMLNALITQSSKVVGYIPDIYNCTTLNQYKYHLINNEKYYAIDSNMIVKI